jgi:predicted HicB family RNase H-like nuclease
MTKPDAPKRGRGRPPKEDPETERLELRLKPARKAAYEAAAARKGKPVGTWAKAVLDRASKR